MSNCSCLREHVPWAKSSIYSLGDLEQVLLAYDASASHLQNGNDTVGDLLCVKP